MRQFIITGLLLLSFVLSHSQTPELNRVEPPNWWIGMQNPELQLLVHGKNIATCTPQIDYAGVELKAVTRLESNNYLFLNLHISQETVPGNFVITFNSTDGETITYSYKLEMKRTQQPSYQATIDASDVMYLITPDRFANGDRSNDSTDDTIEKLNRTDPDGRHGGDLQGIIDHLDYIEDLGVTAIWLNPFLENDQPKYSYHGYGISDFYKTDSRFGSNSDFLGLCSEAHKRGMKIIMDQVFNHCGSGHWWMDDLPSKDWLNQWPQFTRSSFTNLSVSDPYRSDSDYQLHTKGWFDINLPDLNQENPYLAKYLIQNSIWWIEYAELDGIRMDTYPYPEKEVMAEWTNAVLKEYPGFYLVGETWESEAASVSYWNKTRPNYDGFNPNLSSVSDYPLFYAIIAAFGEENKIYRLYENLAYDYLYETPFNNKIFNGNHDQPRPFNLLNKDKDKVKLSMAFVLTTRGIPQLYYGDELLFDGPKPDGIIRKDFPGGWPGDERNLFKREDRTPQETEVHSYVRQILQWRKSATEVHTGKLKHYKPINEEVYVYFRYTKDRSTMVIINNSDKSYDSFNLHHYKESLLDYSGGRNILTGKAYRSLDNIDLAANTAYIIQLTK